jgi:hypothetical protein
MPKDEFDFEDPFELNGMVFPTQEDTTNDMAECFIEEFMRMGYSHKQILALFRNPHYLGPHLTLEKHGQPFVRNLIVDIFARWGRPVSWAETVCPHTEESGSGGGSRPVAPVAEIEMDQSATDPMGAAIPKLTQ